MRISGIGIVGAATSMRLKKSMAWCLFSRLFPSNSIDFGLLYSKFLVLELCKQVQLEEAIEREDFGEAAKLKAAIGEATVNDSVAEIMCQLQVKIVW